MSFRVDKSHAGFKKNVSFVLFLLSITFELKIRLSNIMTKAVRNELNYDFQVLGECPQKMYPENFLLE